ncbi:MAG TPA: T9SS type A sorting domain-containing protein [Crocinitomicaceae bacterium]|nr:T9SS type A sorting domain-containing protein [Crocinitomicaceae bacterium]
MKKLLLIIGLSLVGSITFGQQGDGGSPRYSGNKNAIDSRSFSTPDVAVLLAEDAITDATKDSRWRFGFNNYTNFNLSNSGTWRNLSNGGKIWQLSLTCANALTVNLTLDNVVIPEGNEMYVFNPSKSFILGKFSAKHLYEGQLGTELVPGETAIIEYYVAPENLEAIRSLTINTVTHGYRTAAEFQAKAFGSSGGCNMNSICPDGVPITNAIRATMMLVSGSNGFCTGSMINNTANDGTPYVLTANHCFSNPATWIFRFNWASATCANPGGSPSFQSISGAVLRSRRTPSDFCLVEVTGGLENGTVPLAFNTYFPGWDNNDTPASSAHCVHHPSGDIKKISFDDNALSSANGMGSTEANSQWRVVWDRNTTTEPGSSGSPLFDQNGRIIGQLWGGGASCGNLSAPDYYGKVSYSWNPSGSNSTNQLKFWLDPSNTGVTTLDGYDPIVLCSSSYSNSSTPETCFNDGVGSVTVTFTAGNSTGATFDIGNGPQASGTFTGLTQGTYDIDVIDGDACLTTVSVTVSGPANLTIGAGVNAEVTANSGSINLTINGGTANYSVSWTGPNGFASSSEDISGLAGGTYNVTVTDANGCTVSNSYTVNSFVGIEELDASTVNVYPNPSNGKFNIKFNMGMLDNLKVEVMDLAGRIVITKMISTSPEIELDMSTSSEGTYILHISNDNSQITKRIVVKK